MRHLYVHVPFCARRCSYCDFSIAVRSRTPIDDYLTALSTEIAGKSASLQGSTLHTVYFGGGTPSRLGGEGIARALELVRNSATLAPNAEVTIEANPDDMNDIAVAKWLAAGVNRVSLGSQSFDDSVLEWMHRTHDSARIPDAVATLRRNGIENISLDLIFAVPAHLDRDWQRDLDLALALEPAHISLYGLTVEPHTSIGHWRDRGITVEGTEDVYEEEFLLAHDALTASGFEHYEVSNFGQPRMHSRHNSAYWSSVPYLGLGPAAHSFDGVSRSWNIPAYAEWNRSLLAGGVAVKDAELLTEENRASEAVYLGLRTAHGLAISDAEVQGVRAWIDAGWARIESREDQLVLRLTPAGWLRLDSLASDLAARRSQNPTMAISPTPSHCYI